MKKGLLPYLMGIALLSAACSSSTEVDELTQPGYGTLALGVTAQTDFESLTRAVTESEYANTANYTVEILQNEEVKQSFTYSEKPATITLANGSYLIKAHYGKESAASRTEFYMVGSMPFSVQGKEVTLNVDCAPTCGKLLVKFNTTEMDKHFSDYYVVYETEALKAAGGNATWAKTDTEPWYVKLNTAGETVKATVHYVRMSDGKKQTQTVSYRMAPNQKWTLNIQPKKDAGNLGIDITIDESTVDQDIIIDIPSEWL